MTDRGIARRNDILEDTRARASNDCGSLPDDKVAGECDDGRHSQPERAAPLLREVIA
jgi:hypothetical protein